MKNIAVFASGNGTNAENIIDYFNNNANGERIAEIKVVICNRSDAYVLKRAEAAGVPSIILDKEELTSENPALLFELLEQYKTDYIVLAGYLLKVPALLINRYKEKIMNIHPALLPKYGGKGMYGHRVHQAVIDAGEKESGITVHIADEIYDNGKILFQAKCPVSPEDTAETLAHKIHLLEQEHFPKIIEKYIAGEP